MSRQRYLLPRHRVGAPSAEHRNQKRNSRDSQRGPRKGKTTQNLCGEPDRKQQGGAATKKAKRVRHNKPQPKKARTQPVEIHTDPGAANSTTESNLHRSCRGGRATRTQLVATHKDPGAANTTEESSLFRSCKGGSATPRITERAHTEGGTNSGSRKLQSLYRTGRGTEAGSRKRQGTSHQQLHAG